MGRKLVRELLVLVHMAVLVDVLAGVLVLCVAVDAADVAAMAQAAALGRLADLLEDAAALLELVVVLRVCRRRDPVCRRRWHVRGLLVARAKRVLLGVALVPQIVVQEEFAAGLLPEAVLLLLVLAVLSNPVVVWVACDCVAAVRDGEMHNLPIAALEVADGVVRTA